MFQKCGKFVLQESQPSCALEMLQKMGLNTQPRQSLNTLKLAHVVVFKMIDSLTEFVEVAYLTSIGMVDVNLIW